MSSNIQVLIGRVLMSVIFLVAGFGKLANPAGTAGYMASLGIPLASITVWFVMAVEILGGLAILVGLFTRYAAWILAAFCVATGFAVHFHPGDQMQMINFMKNLAMTGGFLFLASYGPGAFSIDARLGNRLRVQTA